MIVKTPAAQRGFTLIELLVVIGIIALLAAITVPAIGNMKRSDALTSATRQLLDDVGRARHLAISKHTTVYMVFVPARFYQDPNFTSLPPAERTKGDRLYDKQLTSYAFVTLRSVGDQPGQGTPDYIGPWRTMPENTFIATNKFFFAPDRYFEVKDPPNVEPPDRRYWVYGFNTTNGIPFPSEESRQADGSLRFVQLPYIAFNYLGQLVSGPEGRDEYLPIARGSVAMPRDPTTRKPRQGLPVLTENPPGNSTNSFNLIHIDRLTGRARLIQQEISGS